MRLEKPNQPVWYSLIVILFCCTGLVIWNLSYTKSNNIRQDKQWCELLLLLTDPNAPPPTAERQIKIVNALHRLQENKHCEEKVK